METWCIIGNHKVDSAELFGLETDFVTCCSACRPNGPASFTCGACNLKRPIQLAIRKLDVLALNNQARLEAGQHPEWQATADDIVHAALDNQGNLACLYCAHPAWMDMDIERVCRCDVGEHQILERDRCLNRPQGCTVPEDISPGDFCISCSITEPKPIQQELVQPISADLTSASANSTVEDAEEGPVRTNKKFVSFDEVPNTRMFCEYSPGYIFDPAFDMTLAHKEYRGEDRKIFRAKATKTNGVGKKSFDSRQPACIGIHFENGRSLVWGSLPGYDETKEKSPIKVAYKVDTQYPSVELVVRPDSDTKDGKDITCIIYAEAVQDRLDENGHPSGIWSAEAHQFPAGYWEDFGAIFDYANGTIQAYEEHQCWCTALIIDSRRESDIPASLRNDNGPQAGNQSAPLDFNVSTTGLTPQDLPVPEQSKVKFHGINPGRVKELRIKMHEAINASPPAEDPQGLHWDLCAGISFQDQIVGLLAQGLSNLHIYTKVTAREQYGGAYESFSTYWISLMKASLTLGHFWFYRKQRQEGIRLISHDFPLHGLQVPRWLVTKFEVTYDVNNFPTSMVPIHWSSYRLPKILSSEDCTFLVTLGTQSITEARNKSLGRYLTNRKAYCTMNFMESPHKEGQYVVQINLAAATRDGGEEILFPAAKSRVILTIEAYRQESSETVPIELMGFVAEDHFRESCHFAVFCQGKGPIQLGIPIEGKIEVRDDITTAARQINSMIIATNTQQHSGVDIGALLHVREPTVTETAVVKHDFEANPSNQAAFDSVINSRQPSFNDSQKRAAQSVTRSSTGLELISGPPGTGKTDLGQTIVEGLAQCKYRIFVCSSKQEAVNVAFRKFQTVTQLPASQFVRWTGETPPDQQLSQFNVLANTSAEDIQNTDSQQSWSDDMWDMMGISGTSVDPGSGFHAKLHAWVHEVARDPAHRNYEIARTYLETLDSLGSYGLSHHDRQNLTKTANELWTEALAKAYLDSEVRVVFTTHASSGSDTLYKFFRPQVVFVEEAGSATIPDLAVPLAPHMLSIKLVVMAGDKKQLRPILPSANANESANVLNRSLFEILLDDEGADHTPLLTSYRMTGELGGWFSSEFYNNKIDFKGAPNPPLDAFMEAILAPLKKAHAWNGRRRMAIDVSTRADGQFAA